MTESPTPSARVVLALIFGLLSFSFSPILVRLASEAPGATLAVWRCLFAVLMLAPALAVRPARVGAGLEARDWLLILFGGVMLGLHFITWIESLYLTTVASASVLFTTNPIFLVVLGYLFLREKVSVRVVWAIGLAVAGSVLIALGDHFHGSVFPDPNTGNGLALAAAFLFAVYLLVGRVVRRKTSWLAYVFPLYVVVALTTLVYALASSVELFGFSWHVYGACALMALGPQILGHGSFNYAVKYVPAAVLGLLSLIEPVLAGIWAWLLYRERPGVVGAVGMVIVLIALASVYLPALKRRIGSTRAATQ